MKKITLFLILIISYSVAKCQLDQGTWLAGGSGNFYSYNDTKNYSTSPTTNEHLEGKYTNVQISASIGYFIVDKLGLGLRPSFTYLKGYDVGQSTINSRKFSLGPFARYYFLNPEKQYNILADIAYQWGINQSFSTKGKYNNFSLMAGPEIYFNSSIGLEILMGYGSNEETLEGSYSDKKKGFLITTGIQLHLRTL